MTNHWTGRKHSKETKEKMRLSRLKYLESNKHGWLGKKHKPETIQKMTGRKRSNITKERISIARLGDKNGMWKDNDVGIKALHAWVRSHLKAPNFCENCNFMPPHDLANVTGKYERDFSNWKYLCRRCHMISDGRLKRFKNLSRLKYSEER